MERERSTLRGLPVKIKLPPLGRVTPEEIERRRKVVAEILRLREEIGPVDMTVEELLEEEWEEDSQHG